MNLLFIFDDYFTLLIIIIIIIITIAIPPWAGTMSIDDGYSAREETVSSA